MKTTVKCPSCQKLVTWGPESPFRPFCCERCKLIDLGEWAAESHRIPDTSPREDEDIRQPSEETD